MGLTWTINERQPPTRELQQADMCLELQNAFVDFSTSGSALLIDWNMLLARIRDKQTRYLK